MKITVATYNTHDCESGTTMAQIAKDINSVGADIVGLQEIDLLVNRSGNIDILKEISKLSLPYYVYVPTLQLDGGLYGTGILSRFPIQSFEVVSMPSPGVEPRSYGRAEIRLGENKVLHFYNTHLSVENETCRNLQYEVLDRVLSQVDDFILTGDFNAHSFDDYTHLTCGKGVSCPETPYITEEGRPKPFLCIDNIFIKKDSKTMKFLSAATLPRTCSDHNLLYADIEL